MSFTLVSLNLLDGKIQSKDSFANSADTRGSSSFAVLSHNKRRRLWVSHKNIQTLWTGHEWLYQQCSVDCKAAKILHLLQNHNISITDMHDWTGNKPKSRKSLESLYVCKLISKSESHTSRYIQHLHLPPNIWCHPVFAQSRCRLSHLCSSRKQELKRAKLWLVDKCQKQEAQTLKQLIHLRITYVSSRSSTEASTAELRKTATTVTSQETRNQTSACLLWCESKVSSLFLLALQLETSWLKHHQLKLPSRLI